MGKKLAEIMSARMANAIVAQKTWDGLLVLANNYGAEPGGDSTTAIQEAINDAKSQGKREVAFRPGTYYFSSLTDAEDIVFVGDGVTVLGGTPQIPVQSWSEFQRLRAGSSTTLTIADGEITVTKTYHRVDTEGGAATDDLETINGGVEGMFLVLHPSDLAHEVVIKHRSGNIVTFSGDDITLNGAVLLINNGSEWMAFSDVRSAVQLLDLVKTVDGEGSGLDADTVRGIEFQINEDDELEIKVNGNWKKVGGGGVKKVQRGRTLVDLSSGGNVDVTLGTELASIDKAFVSLSTVHTRNQDGSSNFNITAHLTSTSNLRITYYNPTAGNAINAYVAWEVVEFN